MSAREMFEKLGYELYEHKTYMFYEKALKENPEYENDYEHIEFNFISETINKTYGDDNSVSDITLEELDKQVIKHLPKYCIDKYLESEGE